MFCFVASAWSLLTSVSVNITATRFLREFGDRPEPEPFGRPAPSRRPPQLVFFFAFFFGLRAGLDALVVFGFFQAAILFSRLNRQG
jgi:hypothetical protein